MIHTQQQSNQERNTIFYMFLRLAALQHLPQLKRLETGKLIKIQGTDDTEKLSFTYPLFNGLIRKELPVLLLDGSLQFETQKALEHGLKMPHKEGLLYHQICDELDDFFHKASSFMERHPSGSTIIIDEVNSMVYKRLPNISQEAIQHRHAEIRALLSALALKAHEHNCTVILLDTPHLSQFNLIPGKQFREELPHVTFPQHLFGGIVELKIHRVEKAHFTLYKRETIANPLGYRVRVSYRSSQNATPVHGTETLYLDAHHGYTNVSSLLNCAISQNLVHAINHEYFCPSLREIGRGMGFYQLCRYLLNHRQQMLTLANLINWEKTVYGRKIALF